MSRAVALLLLAAAVGCAAVAPARPAVDGGVAAAPPLPRDAFVATVVRVVDGDTLIARTSGSRRLRVRLIGVDAPESVRPDAPVACYGPEAARLMRRVLPPGTRLRAAYQRGGETDRYGRRLWDVWLPDGRFLASVLLAAGAARAYPVRPQVEHAALLAALERQARAGRRGLWAPPCDGHSFDRPP